MNDMGPSFDESLLYKDWFQGERRKLEVDRVQHQVDFSLVIIEKRLTGWHLLLDHETMTFILTIHSTMYEEKVGCGHFSI